MDNKIIIRGARQHNLKNINLELPKNQLITFTGLSGSGKSSLAFDTIYAEGQRRYVESLSSYARQFLGVMDKPDIDSIDGLSPAISVDQKSVSHNPRSTVGTITEIYDYLRLLFARVGHPHCPNCSMEISRQSPQQIVDNIITTLKKLASESHGKPVKFMILSPVVRDRKGEFKELFINLRTKGYQKVRIDNIVFGLEEDLYLIKTNKHTIETVIDQIIYDQKMFDKKQLDIKEFRLRLNQSVEQALALSEGLIIVTQIHDASFNFPEKPTKMTDQLFSEKFACPKCNIFIPEIEPRIFSFNSPHGACSTCSGIGSLLKVDPALIVNPNLSVNEGGILPFARMILSDTWYGRILLTVIKRIGIDPTKPLKLITADKMKKLFYGTGEEIYDVEGPNRQNRTVTIYETFSGIVPELERRYQETESEYVRTEIGKYLRQEICPTCQGKRLKKEALSITIDKKTIVDLTTLSISQSLEWIKNLDSKLNAREKIIANLIIKEINNRMTFLTSVGLDYLTLARNASTLAGGEAQRIRLASQIGSGLSGVLYVLDEPSIGLHPRDNDKLINTLKKLKELGNTVIVVEHDREMMENSDYIYDFGPGAGKNGGHIIAYGTPEEIHKDKNSLTGQYLSGKKQIKIIPLTNNNLLNKNLVIKGCRENNLKNIDVSIPLGKLVCITGVSGSGKSTLLVDTVYPSLASYFNPYFRQKIGKHSIIEGLEYANKVILIDQSPIGRTPRSNPATYTGAFTYIRDLFAQLPQSKMRGYGPGRFSFNVKGGRCEACEGEGQMKIEMQFMPDVYVNCDVCNGNRYNNETLEVKFKNKNIAEILQLTVADALKLFENIPGLYNKLETLNSVGLSYIQLGQPAPQLSGGEAQRIKLAAELSKRSTKHTIYILDEPTTGLHFADLEKLLDVIKRLVEMDNTVIVIEHNLDIIKNADWIIDLGPEGGDNGGQIIATGTPAEIAKNTTSATGKFLKNLLG